MIQYFGKLLLNILKQKQNGKSKCKGSKALWAPHQICQVFQKRFKIFLNLENEQQVNEVIIANVTHLILNRDESQ